MLSVVVVNFNGRNCLPPALRALRDHSYSREIECIVIDSGSTDGSWELVESTWDKAQVLRAATNIGFCAGCNAGAQAGSGDFVAFVNFDSLVEPGWDRPLLKALEHSDVSIAGGILTDPTGEWVEAAGLAIAPNMATYGLGESLPRSVLLNGPSDVTAVSGALMMMRRSEFLDLGGFYEPIWMYGEEADLCLRVPGRIVTDPRSAARHEIGHAAGPPRSTLRLYWPSRNRLINAARHLPGRKLAVSVLASAAFDLLTLAQLRSWEAAGAVARGWRDGLVAMGGERRARTRAQKREASSKLTTLREAIHQQRRLGRL